MCPWRRGSVLVLVVWTISLLSILALGLGSRCAFALELAERLEGQLRAAYIAAAGVYQAVEVLAQDKSRTSDGMADNWAENPTAFNEHPFASGSFTVEAAASHYGLIDQERFINLNTASPEILKGLLLRAAAVKDLEAEAIAESIVDWRDKDQEPLADGAETFYYLGLSPPYECKNAPLESVEELLLIRGVTPSIYRRLHPYVTVYGSGEININTASDVVLASLGLSPTGVQGLLSYRAGEDDTPGTSDDRAIASVAAAAREASLPAEDANRLAKLVSEKQVGVRSTVFEVRSSANAGRQSASRQVTAVIDRKGKVLAWAER